MLKKIFKSVIFIVPTIILLIFDLMTGITNTDVVDCLFCAFNLFILYSIYYFVTSIWELRRPVIKNNIQKFFLGIAHLLCYGVWILAIITCIMTLWELNK